ncbi:MAG TPA: sigma-70 family RNA polymerase sigma factor [Pedococcus sp.]|nr:sigma-70 family RNA polymerase sigma factor [Pedococcus sp.]
MSAPIDLSEVDDLELTSRAREGEERAVVELWTRHYPAALATARRVARQPRDAEELAADAFSGMLAALNSGGGPTGSVRAYLLTSVRNGVTTRARRANAADVLTDETTVLENAADVPADPVAAAGELSLMREAFAALPTRWQHVLWRTAVDHESNITVGEELGLSANAVAALARRARQGLRAAYVQVHVSRGAVDPGCVPFIGGLAALLTNPDSTSETAIHVRGCARCTERLAELRRVDRNLSGVLTPALLTLFQGGAGGALVAATGGAGAVSGAGASAGASSSGGAGGASGAASSGSTTTLGAGTWVTMAAAATLGMAALVWAVWPHESAGPAMKTTRPLVTATAPKQTPSTPVTAASTTSSTPPTVQPPRAAPRPSATVAVPPVPVPTSRPPSMTAPPGSLSMGLAMAGPAQAPYIQVSVSGQHVVGGLSLSITVPEGATLRGSTAAWTQCVQSGRTIRCTAAPSSSSDWSGTISTSWLPESSGPVTAVVAGVDRSGRRVTASAATTWPSP